MEDSFEARLAGQKPVTEKKKSSKGWMICSIIALVLLVGVGVFAGILFFNKDDSKVANLEKTVEEKDAKIAELENGDSADTKCKSSTTDDSTDGGTTNATATEVINVDMNTLKTAAKQTDSLKDYTGIVLKMSEGGKYIIAGGQAVEDAETGDYYLYMYKENKVNASWNKLYGTQAEIPCSSLTEAQKDIFHGVEDCIDDEGHYQAL